MKIPKSFHGSWKIINRVNLHIQTRPLSNTTNKINGHDSILPVLIIGAGPVGLVLSFLLTKLGVKCAVLEKRTDFSKHPQAHFINNRSMEVFRKLDGLAEDILKSQPPVDFWRKFIYCTSLTGPILGSVDHIQPQDFDRIVSPVSVAHYSQYKLSELLLNKLKSLGFLVNNSSPKGINGKQILMGHECISIKDSDNYITVTTLSNIQGKSVTKEIKCNFLVGADGARSKVRDLIAIKMKGEKDLQKLVSVHFLSKDLGEYLIKERPGMLFFVFNTEAIGVLVAHDLKQGEFVLQAPYYPPQQKLEDFSSEMCETLISKLVGQELKDINVLDIKPWNMHAQVAEKFQAYNNKIILAGDSAHRFPPAGGFGMNTGIQDAHNLAWKLATVLQGIAPLSFLSTYEVERKQIANFNTALSIENFKAAMKVPATLGLDPTIANTVHRVINDTVGSILPSGLQRTILNGIFSIGRAQLSDFVLNENNFIGSSRLSRLKEIFEGGKSLQLQFPAEDLGFRYHKGALVPDEENISGTPEKPMGRRREYIPSTIPGSKLPHITLKLLSDPSIKISSLDLISIEKIEFILIIAPIKESYLLAQAISIAAERIKVPLKVCVIWPENTIHGESENACKSFVDFVEIKDSLNFKSWWDLCGITEKGAVLVRPDEHVAWRVKSEIVNDPVLCMTRVFDTILGL